MTQIYLFMKKKQIHRHKNYGYQKGLGRRDKLGVQDQQIDTTIYKIDKQGSYCMVQGTVCYSKHTGKEYEKGIDQEKEY